MTRVCAGSIGSDLPPTKLDLDLPQPWPDLLSALCPNGLRPIQSLALPAILCGQQHLVITAPTNSGKSLCAHTELLRTCQAGQRAVLIEPMRVIANEQAETIQDLIEKLDPVLSSKPHVRLSTGEFRHRQPRNQQAQSSGRNDRSYRLSRSHQR